MDKGRRHIERQHDRMSVELPIEFKNKQKLVVAQVANIGAGGMCIKTTEVLPVNAQSFFRIVPKDGGVHFNLEAQVMWSQPTSKIRQRRARRPGLMGLKFVTSRFLTSDTINSLLQQAKAIEPVASAS